MINKFIDYSKTDGVSYNEYRRIQKFLASKFGYKNEVGETRISLDDEGLVLTRLALENAERIIVAC